MTPKEALEQRDRLLDDYESRAVGLPAALPPGENDELHRYLTMDRGSIESISADECAIIATRLVQFGFHVQRAQNRELSRVTWAKNEAKMSVADKLNNYQGYSYEERYGKAIKDNDYARDIHNIMIYAQQRADRLNFVANGLKNLSETFKSIQFNKRQE